MYRCFQSENLIHSNPHLYTATRHSVHDNNEMCFTVTHDDDDDDDDEQVN